MTPRERAHEIAQQVLHNKDQWWLQADEIEKAIRDAEDAAYERAAGIAARVGVLECNPSGEFEEGWHKASNNIRIDILKLKHTREKVSE